MLQPPKRDLTPFQEAPSFPLANVLSVGWLGISMDYKYGQIGEPFLNKLRAIYFEEIDGCKCLLSGGSYECPFGCDDERLVEADGRWRGPFGIKEIWIPSNSYILYCAPGLLIHYIQRHGYCPPDCFVDAVMALDERTNFDIGIARMQSLAIANKGHPVSRDQLESMGFLKPGDPMPWNKLPPPFDLQT